MFGIFFILPSLMLIAQSTGQQIAIKLMEPGQNESPIVNLISCLSNQEIMSRYTQTQWCKTQFTLLFLAIVNGYPRVTQALLYRNADLFQTHKNDLTPLNVAFITENPEIANMCFKALKDKYRSATEEEKKHIIARIKTSWHLFFNRKTTTGRYLYDKSIYFKPNLHRFLDIMGSCMDRSTLLAIFTDGSPENKIDIFPSMIYLKPGEKRRADHMIDLKDALVLTLKEKYHIEGHEIQHKDNYHQFIDRLMKSRKDLKSFCIAEEIKNLIHDDQDGKQSVDQARKNIDAIPESTLSDNNEHLWVATIRNSNLKPSPTAATIRLVPADLMQPTRHKRNRSIEFDQQYQPPKKISKNNHEEILNDDPCHHDEIIHLFIDIFNHLIQHQRVDDDYKTTANRVFAILNQIRDENIGLYQRINCLLLEILYEWRDQGPLCSFVVAWLQTYHPLLHAVVQYNADIQIDDHLHQQAIDAFGFDPFNGGRHEAWMPTNETTEDLFRHTPLVRTLLENHLQGIENPNINEEHEARRQLPRRAAAPSASGGCVSSWM